MAESKTETTGDELEAAARRLEVESPVHAPGRARVLRVHDGDGYDELIAICDRHDDPDNPPPNSRYGQCGDCKFVKTYDVDLAKQVAALINVRPSLQAWLESWDEIDLSEAGPLPTDYEHALKIARALNRSPS